MGGHDNNNEFRGLITALADGAADEAACREIETGIWKRYGTRGVVFVSDMCRFSLTTRTRGICHFLAMIEQTRRIIAPEILRHGGKLLKFEIDNSFAFFADVDAALHCARGVLARAAETNLSRASDDQISIAIGIDHGDLLLIDDAEFFGDPVNTACKLGEDIAAEGETLVTARALELSTRDLAYVMERKRARISGIDIEYASIAFMHARGRR